MSIKNAPSGAVMTMPCTASDSTMLPQVSPAAHGGAKGRQRLNTPNSPFFSQGAEETSFTS